MEARDTVMNEEQLGQVEQSYLREDYAVNAIRLNRGHTEELRQRIAQAQAEVSFKAGIKEVVRWLNGCRIFTAEQVREGEKYTYLGSYILKWGKEGTPSYGFAPFDECPEWQAKLKEWLV